MCTAVHHTWRTVKLVRPASDAVDSGARSFSSLTFSMVRSRTAVQRRRADPRSSADAPELGLATTWTAPSTWLRMCVLTKRRAALASESNHVHRCCENRSSENRTA
jgi:hypothetical protein